MQSRGPHFIARNHPVGAASDQPRRTGCPCTGLLAAPLLRRSGPTHPKRRSGPVRQLRCVTELATTREGQPTRSPDMSCSPVHGGSQVSVARASASERAAASWCRGNDSGTKQPISTSSGMCWPRAESVGSGGTAVVPLGAAGQGLRLRFSRPEPAPWVGDGRLRVCKARPRPGQAPCVRAPDERVSTHPVSTQRPAFDEVTNSVRRDGCVQAGVASAVDHTSSPGTTP